MKNLFAVLGLFLLITGCSSETDSSNSTPTSEIGAIGTPDSQPSPQKIEFTDALGQTVSVENPKRVVAASGSFAQIWTLAGGTLIGATADAFDSGFADDGVVNIGGNHEPELEQIFAAQPDFVILSADIAGQVKLRDSLISADIATACFSAETFEDYLGMLEICTDITGQNGLYRQNGLDIRDRIADIKAESQSAEKEPKILLLRASSGKVTARDSDTMTGIMLKELGCVNIADSESGLLEDLNMEVIIQKDPDFIFVTTMGESDDAQKALEDVLFSNPAWSGLTAVQNDRYTVLPKELFHQKPNNRWAEAYEILWGILNE